MTELPRPVPATFVVLLILASVFLAFLAILFASQATLGAVLVGIALLLAVLARINQAGKQHKETWEWMNQTKGQAEPR